MARVSQRSVPMPTKSRLKRPSINPLVQIRSPICVYPDASGAPAVLAYRGFAFALDMLGEVKLRLIEGSNMIGTRIQSKVARDACLTAYLALLDERVDESWRERNVRLYDDEQDTCPSTHGHYCCVLPPGHDGDYHQTEGGATRWRRGTP